MKKILEALDQYTGISKETIMDSSAKLSKSFEKLKRESPKMIDGKIDLKKLDMLRMLPIFVDGLPDIAYTLVGYSKALK